MLTHNIILMMVWSHVPEDIWRTVPETKHGAIMLKTMLLVQQTWIRFVCQQETESIIRPKKKRYVFISSHVSVLVTCLGPAPEEDPLKLVRVG